VGESYVTIYGYFE